MVEDERDVVDAVGDLGDAQEQVVVLRPLEPDAEPAGRLEHLPAEAGEVVDVVVTEQQFRGPVRLELRVVPAAGGVDLVLVAVDQVRVRA